MYESVGEMLRAELESLRPEIEDDLQIGAFEVEELCPTVFTVLQNDYETYYALYIHGARIDGQTNTFGAGETEAEVIQQMLAHYAHGSRPVQQVSEQELYRIQTERRAGK